MGIERGGISEYEEYEPSFEEKTAKWEETLQSLLAEDPSLLKLSGKYIANDDVTIICNYHGLEKVRILDLADNQISDDALPVLFESENLAQIEELYLGINFLTGQGLTDVARSNQIKMKNLKTLAISDNRLTDSSVADFMRSGNFPNLKSLDIGWNEVGKISRPHETCHRGIRKAVIGNGQCFQILHLDLVGTGDIRQPLPRQEINSQIEFLNLCKVF
jgi:Leucine-rich repeat (LRR) protein